MVSETVLHQAKAQLTGNILDCIEQYINKFLILERSILLALQVGKRAFRRVFRDLLLVFAKPLEKLMHRDLRGRLPHQLFIDLLSPLLIIGTDSGMPAIREVEFHGTLITETRWSTLAALHLHSRILLLVSLGPNRALKPTYQAPSRIAPVQIDNGA